MKTITDRVKYIKSLPQKTKQGAAIYVQFVGGDINGVVWENDEYVIIAAANGPEANIYYIFAEKKKFLCFPYISMIFWGGSLGRYKQKIVDYKEWKEVIKL